MKHLAIFFNKVIALRTFSSHKILFVIGFTFKYFSLSLAFNALFTVA